MARPIPTRRRRRSRAELAPLVHLFSTVLLAARAGTQARQPVFGCSLETHLAAIDRPIASPLELCCAALIHTNGLAEEVHTFHFLLYSYSSEDCFAQSSLQTLAD